MFYQKIKLNITEKVWFWSSLWSSIHLRENVKKANDQTETEQQKYVVYKIDWENCDKTHVGQTKQLLETIICEHQKNKNQNQKYFTVKTRHIKNMNNEHNIN